MEPRATGPHSNLKPLPVPFPLAFHSAPQLFLNILWPLDILSLHSLLGSVLHTAYSSTQDTYADLVVFPQILLILPSSVWSVPYCPHKQEPSNLTIRTGWTYKCCQSLGKSIQSQICIRDVAHHMQNTLLKNDSRRFHRCLGKQTSWQLRVWCPLFRFHKCKFWNETKAPLPVPNPYLLYEDLACLNNYYPLNVFKWCWNHYSNR